MLSKKHYLGLFLIVQFFVHAQVCAIDAPEDNSSTILLDQLEQADFVTIVITVPETHSDIVREAIGRAGAGKFGNYSFCSFTTKGEGRFVPDDGAHPQNGMLHVLQKVVEEQIEAICPLADLEKVLEEIKKVHPYESTVINIYPFYKIGFKLPKER